MAKKNGKFIVIAADGQPRRFKKDAVYFGRLASCEVRLDDNTVSRIHASITFQNGRYSLSNLSKANVLTLNGRPLGPQKSDVLADGDTIQIGPFVIDVARTDEGILLRPQRAVEGTVGEPKSIKDAMSSADKADAGGVLDAFWDKRTREKEDWGTRLRPTAEPIPGKAMFNWRPTGDLRRPWAVGLFIWAFVVVGVIAIFAYYKYPQAYAPKPLSNAHATDSNERRIAIEANKNSCTTCHSPGEPMENSCIRCHTAEQFHASNTKAHEDAGIICTACHKEHQGQDYSLNGSAILSCAQCHNDSNRNSYNGNLVRTAHGGSYGYPASDGKWTWQGLYREEADAIPEVNAPATGDKDDQNRISRHFHAVHVARLKVPVGLAGDKFGLVSCSTCHKSFEPVDRVTPSETCGVCHMNAGGDASRDQRFPAGQANCISCHVQHPYSSGWWSEFLSDEALKRRNDAVTAKLRGQKK
ncbi:MAG: FHA domain-containing protein [Pyrinomonadaceae bacterium]|nr:FHA domain-containing protein [Pyrinomonadaceae bacterium]